MHEFPVVLFIILDEDYVLLNRKSVDEILKFEY